jgi:acetyl-CoA carboxylase biotin carboxyl carrier protein
MDLRKLKTLIDLVSDSNVSELEITEAEGRVRIVKAPNIQTVHTYVQAASNGTQPALTDGPRDASATGVSTVPIVSGHTVKSPMVGTLYRSSSPETPPFVEIGSTVTEGQTLCIVEAMKILNEIESDKAGIVRQILIKNGEAVEYGQPLFVIE